MGFRRHSAMSNACSTTSVTCRLCRDLVNTSRGRWLRELPLPGVKRVLANAEPLGHLCNRVAPFRDLRGRVTLENVHKMTGPHRGLLASKLGRKASTDLGAVHHPRWWSDEGGRKTWPVNGYAREGERRTNWFTDGVIKYHRRLGTTLNSLIAAGWTFRHVEEFVPTAAQIAEQPGLAEELERPMMLLVSVQR